MSVTFDSVAETRPRVGRDVLFTASYDGVLFHTASGGFKIASKSAYQLAALLVPVLDGTRSVAQLCADLPDPQREMVAQLVQALLSRGFARDVPADQADPAELLGAPVAAQFEAQLGYLDHYADHPARRFAAFRQAAVAVIGTGPVPHACTTALVRNGLAQVTVFGDTDDVVEEERIALTAAGVETSVTVHNYDPHTLGWDDLAGIDVVLVAGGNDAPGVTHRLLSSGPGRATVVPAWTFGSQVVVGPASGTERRSCWYCALLRLTPSNPSEASRIWRSLAVGRAAAGSARLTGPTASMIGNLLAFEAFRLSTGAPEPETDGRVILQDLDSFDVTTEDLLPHPECGFCAPEPPVVSGGVRSLDEDPAIADAESDEAVDRATHELDARDLLLAPRVGVFTSYGDEAWQQTPVRIGTVRFCDADGMLRQIHAFDVHHVVGARTRALAHAAVAYADRFGVLAAAQDAPGSEMKTVSGVSLLDGERVSVPSSAADPMWPVKAGPAGEPSRAGAGAGFDEDSAIRDALSSALAFRALATSIASGGSRQVPLEGLAEDPALLFLTKAAANLGIRVELLDLGANAPGRVHVLLARSAELDGEEPPAIKTWTIAADPSWRRAATRAMCDLIGEIQLRRQSTSEEGDTSRALDGRDPVLMDFDADTLVPLGVGPVRIADDRSWSAVIAGIDQAGTDVVVVPLGGADLSMGGITAVRVILTDRVPR